VSRSTRLFLLAGCACILLLEAPRTLAALSRGWRGPYVDATAAVSLAGERVATGVTAARPDADEPELARR
jgi:hypothetical protein